MVLQSNLKMELMEKFVLVAPPRHPTIGTQLYFPPGTFPLPFPCLRVHVRLRVFARLRIRLRLHLRVRLLLEIGGPFEQCLINHFDV